MYLFLDSETNGLPKDYKAAVEDVDNWPRVVELAWRLCGLQGRVYATRRYVVKPDGWTIPKTASDIHGITQDFAEEYGTPLEAVLDEFTADLLNVYPLTFVAHNFAFDSKVVGAEFVRQYGYDPFSNDPNRSSICTMQASTDYCQLPGHYGKYKWPKLEQLWEKLFEEAPDAESMHSAEWDVMACAKCFFALVDRGIIQVDDMGREV